MKDNINIELRNTEIEEILIRPPHILIRAGACVVGIIIGIILIGSFCLKYPDTIEGKVVITTENPPIWLIAKSTGRIKELLCYDKQVIEKDKIIAIIENPAKTNDIFNLIEILNKVRISDSIIFIPNKFLKTNFELGDVQPNFSKFIKAVVYYNNHTKLNPYTIEKNDILNQLDIREKYILNLKNQINLKKREIEISKSIYQREMSLFENRINTQYDLENNEQYLLSKQQEFLQLNISITLAEIENCQLKNTIKNTSMREIEETNKLISDLKISYIELKSSLDRWKQNYALISPQDGIITFNSFWKQNQYVIAGDKVIAIIPNINEEFIGKIKLPIYGSGKVEIGQKVNIKILGYSHLEFGCVNGIVKNKSLIPTEDHYTVEIIFTNGLCTSSGLKINFTGELSGTAEIITADRTLFDRFYSPLQSLFQKGAM